MISENNRFKETQTALIESLNISLSLVKIPIKNEFFEIHS